MASFVWYGLMTTDPQAAAGFYGKVVGWAAEPNAMGMDYTLLKAAGRDIAGVMPTPGEAQDQPPKWYGYVGVDDVDAAASALEGAGGRVFRAPSDIPQVGRFAVVADPQGAAFMLFSGAGEAPEPLPYMTPGTIGWNELHTSDLDTALDFYIGQFGWEKDTHLDTPMGSYQILRMGREHPIGAAIKSQLGPNWLFYFAVPDIDAATQAITDQGGTKMHGPVEVPGGAWITMGSDPQGALFALVGMKTAEGE